MLLSCGATDYKHGDKPQDSRTGKYPIAPKRQTKSLAEQSKPQECDTEIQQRGLQLELSHRPNETKLSHRWRQRALLQSLALKSCES